MVKGDIVIIVKGPHTGKSARLNNFFEHHWYLTLVNAEVPIEIRVFENHLVSAVGS